MNRKIKNVASLIVVVVLMVSASAVYANPEKGVREGKIGQGKKMRANFIEELNLTPEQQEQLKTQRSANKEDHKQLREKLRAKREELRQELEKQEINKEKVYSIIAEIKVLTGEELEQRVERIISMKEVLTPEQYQQLQEKMKEKRKTHKQFFGQGDSAQNIPD
ncbi:MAG: periplasmic heavy metal sensor [Candidatus Omnitrophota bacterium]